MGDSDFGLVRLQDINWRACFSGEVTARRDWSNVFCASAGRLQRGRTQEVIRAVEARPGEEAIVIELDLKLVDLRPTSIMH